MTEPAVFAHLAAQGDLLNREQQNKIDTLRTKQVMSNPLVDALWKCERVMTKEAGKKNHCPFFLQRIHSILPPLGAVHKLRNQGGRGGGG